MALEPAPAIRRPVTLTPLIDVIFLLLLFFMLSSTFTRFGEVALTNAGGEVPTEGAPPLFLQLRAEDLSLNGSALTLDALAPALGERAAEGSTTVLLVTVAAPLVKMPPPSSCETLPDTVLFVSVSVPELSMPPA